MLIYLLIVGDMLVGSPPHYAGVLPTALGRHDGPWWLGRNFVVSPSGVPLCVWGRGPRARKERG
jgi:hypothetical protein